MCLRYTGGGKETSEMMENDFVGCGRFEVGF